MGFAKTAPKIIIALNVLSALIGIVVLAGAIYVSVTPAYSIIFPTSAIWLAGAAGIFIFLVSFLGCRAAEKEWKTGLAIYLLLVAGIFALQVAGGVIYGSYLGIIKLPTTSTYSSKALAAADSLSIQYNNAVLSIYTTCCTGCPATSFCYNKGSIVTNGTATEFCPSVVQCVPVLPCASLTPETTACYVGLNTSSTVPPYTIAPAVCSSMASIKSGGFPIVAKPSEGGCGKTEQTALGITIVVGTGMGFLKSVSTFLNSQLTWVLGIGGAIAAIEVLLIFATLAALCAKPEKRN